MRRLARIPLRETEYYMKSSNFRTDTVPYLASIVGGTLLLEVLARVLDQPYFPKMSGVLSRLVSLLSDGDVLMDLSRSLQNLVVGFLISAILGIFIGVLCGRYEVVERVLRPYINIMLTSPSILFIPIYFAVFGLSRWAIIVLIVDYSIFFLIVSTTTAVRGVNQEIVEMSKIFGASERQQWRLIYLPSAIPVVFSALRIALGRAIKGMINGELFIAVIGIGARSQSFARRFDMEGVFALATLIVGIALILGFFLGLIDKRVNKWVPETRRGI